MHLMFDAKRLIVRKLEDDSEVQSDIKHVPVTVFSKGAKPYIYVEYRGEQKELNSSMVLLKMKYTAESYFGITINSAVVTFSAYFNDSRRQTTHPWYEHPSRTAAAIPYGTTKRSLVVIFDLGRGRTVEDLSSNLRTFCRLCTACKRAKCTLSLDAQTSIKIDTRFEGIDLTASRDDRSSSAII
ncbi:Hsp70 protein-domain-containing protein [Mycena vitilis]|nr:Hsp70 protein-domain-containing protein [Mycena vitilis]